MPGHKAGALRRRLRFWGQVQGVGFRWRARAAAQQLGLTGWVQNLPDGSVLLEAQGPEEGIDRLILCLENSLYIRIENFSTETLPLRQEDRGFSIKD